MIRLFIVLSIILSSCMDSETHTEVMTYDVNSKIVYSGVLNDNSKDGYWSYSFNDTLSFKIKWKRDTLGDLIFEYPNSFEKDSSETFFLEAYGNYTTELSGQVNFAFIEDESDDVVTYADKLEKDFSSIHDSTYLYESQSSIKDNIVFKRNSFMTDDGRIVFRLNLIKKIGNDIYQLNYLYNDENHGIHHTMFFDFCSSIYNKESKIVSNENGLIYMNTLVKEIDKILVSE